MSVIAHKPARVSLFSWLAGISRPRRSRVIKPRETGPGSDRAELDRALVLSQMPEHLRRDLGVDGGARMAQPDRRSGWPIW